MKKILLLTIILLLLPSVFAISINDTIVQSLGLNTNITFNVTRHYDTLAISSSGIYFENYRLTDIIDEKITFNLTESNVDYRVNTTNKDLPYYNSSNTTRKIITSAFVNTLPVIATFDAVCGVGSPSFGDLTKVVVDRPSLITTTYTWANFTCNGDDTVTLLITPGIEQGDNTLNLSYSIIPTTVTPAVTTTCNSIFDSTSDAFILAAIVLIVMAAVGIIMALNMGLGSIDLKVLIGTLIVASMILIVGYYIIAISYSSIC